MSGAEKVELVPLAGELGGGLVGGVLASWCGAFGGFAVGYLAGDQGWGTLGYAGVGAIALCPAGSALGTHLAGSAILKQRGSLPGAFAGAYLGAATGIGLALALERAGSTAEAIGMTSIFWLPPIGAVAGYNLFPAPAKPQPKTSFRLQPPVLSMALSGKGAQPVARLALLSLSF
jgi:hypothetical protein